MLPIYSACFSSLFIAINMHWDTYFGNVDWKHFLYWRNQLTYTSKKDRYSPFPPSEGGAVSVSSVETNLQAVWKYPKVNI